MVDDDDPRALGPVPQLGVEPPVVLAPDLALVEVGFGGVDRHDLGTTLGDATVVDRVAGPKKSSKCR